METLVSSWRRQCRQGLPKLPLRDGNSRTSIPSCRLSFLPKLPLRDGNREPMDAFRTRHILPKLPLRDGNDSGSFATLLAVCTSETSSKGWKLKVYVLHLNLEKPSETSSKGWKQCSHAPSISGPSCFRNFLRGMETVPSPQYRFSYPTFRNFLRGMETSENQGARRNDAPFRNFLRGMETYLLLSLTHP